MQRSTLYPIAGAATLAMCGIVATCRPEPGPQPEATTPTSAGGSGAGGAAAPADDADASATSTASTGAPAPVCQVPSPKGTACDTPGDCWDSSPCTEDRCDLSTPPSPPDPYGRRGTCRWTVLADGTGCDVSDGTDACQRGACCPPGVLPPVTPAAAPTAAGPHGRFAPAWDAREAPANAAAMPSEAR